MLTPNPLYDKHACTIAPEDILRITNSEETVIVGRVDWSESREQLVMQTYVQLRSDDLSEYVLLGEEDLDIQEQPSHRLEIITDTELGALYRLFERTTHLVLQSLEVDEPIPVKLRECPKSI